MRIHPTPDARFLLNLLSIQTWHSLSHTNGESDSLYFSGWANERELLSSTIQSAPVSVVQTTRTLPMFFYIHIHKDGKWNPLNKLIPVVREREREELTLAPGEHLQSVNFLPWSLCGNSSRVLFLNLDNMPAGQHKWNDVGDSKKCNNKLKAGRKLVELKGKGK